MNTPKEKPQEHTAEQSRRARARWAILRNALLQGKSQTIDRGTCGDGKSNLSDVAADNTNKDNNSDNDISSFSIHRFKGFQVLNRKVIQNPYSTMTNDNDSGSGNKDGEGDNDDEYHDEYEYVEYKIPLGDKNNDVIKFRTREKKQQQQNKNKVNMKELMSHVYYGVDNTGNTRVWECSKILTHVVVTAMMKSVNVANSDRSGEELDCMHVKTDTTEHPLPPDRSKSWDQLTYSLEQSTKVDSKLIPNICLKDIFSRARTMEDCNNTGNSYNTFPKRRLRIIELGSGMAALPSLALAAVATALGMMQMDNVESSNHLLDSNDNNCAVPYMDIVVTDGHPKSVANNKICSKLTLDLHNDKKTTDEGTDRTPETCLFSFTSPSKEKGEEYENGNKDPSHLKKALFCSIETKQLLWKASDEGRMECQSLIQRCRKNDDIITNEDDNYLDYFDLVLVSDCIHFTEFHAGLITTIGRLLRVNGLCLLCQPKRGSSLDQFIQLITAINDSHDDCDGGSDGDHDNSSTRTNSISNESKRGPLFDSRLYHDYSKHISNQHQDLLKRQDDKVYDPNIHYPLILELKKLREYNEDVDTRFALHHVKQRER